MEVKNADLLTQIVKSRPFRIFIDGFTLAAKSFTMLTNQKAHQVNILSYLPRHLSRRLIKRLGTPCRTQKSPGNI